MKLTKEQKRNLGNLIWGVLVAGVVSFAVWGMILLAHSLNTPAQANTPPVPQVNSSRYEQINTPNDGTVDHSCIGKDGLFFGVNTGDFTAVANNPLCH